LCHGNAWGDNQERFSWHLSFTNSMPIFNRIVRAAVKPIPAVITPKARAVLDYAMAGSFFLAAGWFWRRNRQAATAALLCGGTELGIALLTDYPGGGKKMIHFPARREIDFGLSTMLAATPEFFAFDHEPEEKFFVGQAAILTAANELTRFPERALRRKRRAA
jgi:hypothetical protein